MDDDRPTVSGDSPRDDLSNSAARFAAEQLSAIAAQLGNDPASPPTDKYIAGFLEQVTQLATETDPRILASLVGLRHRSTSAKRRGVSNAVDRYLQTVDPGVDHYSETLRLLEEASDEELAGFTSGLQLFTDSNRPGTRLAWMTALLSSDRRGALSIEAVWRRIDARDLADLHANGLLSASELLGDPAVASRVAGILQDSLKNLDAGRIGDLLGVEPAVLGLLPDGVFGRALERFARASENGRRMRELLAVPLVKARDDLAREEGERERAEHTEFLEAKARGHEQAVEEFGRQLGELNEEIEGLRAELQVAQQRLATSSTAAAEPTERLRQQERIDALRPIAERIRDLLRDGDPDSVRSADLLEQAVAPVGLEVLDQPGDVAAFDPERHERLIPSTSDEVRVLEASVVLRLPEGSTLVLVRALVEEHQIQQSAPVARPASPTGPLPELDPGIRDSSVLATCAIDFGTSTVLASVRRLNSPVSVLPIGEATVWMPSLVGVRDDGTIVVGEEAERSVADSSLLLSVKTLLGRGRDTVTLAGQNGDEISIDVNVAVAELLKEAVRRARTPENEAEAFGAADVQFHLSCPANWEGAPRRRLAEIAQGIGLPVDVTDVVDEPIAAGISWVQGAIDRGEGTPVGKNLIVDFGGGTLDVAVIEVSPPIGDRPPGITVLAADALPNAGDKLDELIAREILSRQIQHEGEHFDELDAGFQQQLRLTARDLKHRLTDVESAEIRLRGELGSGMTLLRLSREELERIFDDQLVRARGLLFAQLRSAALRQIDGPELKELDQLSSAELADTVDRVLLTGGMSRVPYTAKWLAGWFEGKISVDDRGHDRESSVVLGLGYDEAVSELNIHRPAFDIRVAYSKDGTVPGPDEAQTIYPAFRRLYEWWHPYAVRFNLGYSLRLRAPVATAGWSAFIFFVAAGGTRAPIRFDVDGEDRTYLQIPLDSQGHADFKLYINGRMVIRGQRQLTLIIRRWPVIRGRGDDPLLEVQEEPPRERPPELDPGWWHGGE